ncbi:MAG TPA: acyl-CoA thioesterase domain-containing protein [Acidimicrobiales bacterium]|nr:acyl-CoA thioesterase domain-containing protein [Acidimicrobiales bacterium]
MSSLQGLLGVFDVEQVDTHRYRGLHDGGDRAVIDGSQVLAQSIVAATKSCSTKVVRSAHSVFVSAVDAAAPIDLDVEVVRDGRTVASARVVGRQGDRVKVDTSVLLDTAQPDVVRRCAAVPPTDPPEDAVALHMPVDGREIRLVGVVDPNDPDHVGPPLLDAWLRYDAPPPPPRDDLTRALLAHFTGHLSISTTLFPHAGLGTAQSHHSISTGPLTITVAFHEPVSAEGWLLYRHESTQVGAGMSYVRGQVFRQTGELVASFTQEALIRALDAAAQEIRTEARL